MEELLISKDGRYVQMLGKMLDTHTNLHFDMDTPNPIFVCEMFKNEFLFSHKHKLYEGVDLFVKMKKLIYPLLESNQKNIMEYEVRYGNMILTESFNSIMTPQLINETWDFVKGKLFEEFPMLSEQLWDSIKSGASSLWDKTKEVAGKAWDKTKEVAGKAWDGIKSAASWVLDKGLPWFMEKVEKFMLSPVGIGLDIALTAIGVGKLATGIIWGILGVWKIYQLISGKISGVWAYIDIAVCFVGLIFSGAAKGLRVAAEAVGGNIAKLSPKFLGPLMEMLAGGAGKIVNLMAKPMEWLASIFGSKAQSMVSTAKSSITKVFTDMKATFSPALQKAAVANPSLKSVITKGISKDIVNPLKNVTGAMARKGATKGLAWGGGFYGLQKGMEHMADKRKDYAAKKQSEDLGKLASAIPDETIKQGIEDDLSALDAQMS